MTFEPRFDFLFNLPSDLDTRPALVSALQAFETSIVLLGVGRFPAALIMCAGAMESVIKATQNSKFEKSVGLKRALQQAFELLEEETRKTYSGEKENFRDARNEFVHAGCSPADDGRAIELLLRFGYPILNKIFADIHGISIRDSVRYAEIDDQTQEWTLWKHIELAERVLDKTAKAGFSNIENWQLNSVKVLQHAICFDLKAPLHESWLSANDLLDLEFHPRHKTKERVEQDWEPFTYVDCPIPSCNSLEECIVALDRNLQHATKAFCFDCFLRLGDLDSILLECLFDDDLARRGKTISKDYGP